MNMAQVRFNKHLQAAEANLKAVKKQINQLKKDRNKKADKSGWQYVADMNHLADSLQDLIWEEN